VSDLCYGADVHNVMRNKLQFGRYVALSVFFHLCNSRTRKSVLGGPVCGQNSVELLYTTVYYLLHCGYALYCIRLVTCCSVEIFGTVYGLFFVTLCSCSMLRFVTCSSVDLLYTTVCYLLQCAAALYHCLLLVAVLICCILLFVTCSVQLLYTAVCYL
jgi:hypothetical protein